jgi:hypothetical protein
MLHYDVRRLQRYHFSCAADLRMTMRAYAHLVNRTVTKVLRENLPSFGKEKTNVESNVHVI